MAYILLVEDDPYLCDIYCQKLESEGFEVGLAQNGREALGMLKQRKPDILLLDILLPEMGGWEILTAIKNDKTLNGLKTVVLSSLGQKEEVKKGLELGAVKYLIKTQFKPSEVVRKVQEILSKN